jgi:hypothetical protein
LIGQLYREGTLYTQEPIEVFDHDWASLATGVAIPHGLYDLTDNVGYIHIGTSHDTTEFACDSIRHWWTTYGKRRYPLATSILLLCDGGGSNSSRYYLFKQDLQGVANDLGIEIRIAHYPPYWSLDKLVVSKRSALETDRSVGEAEKALPNSVSPWIVSLT